MKSNASGKKNGKTSALRPWGAIQRLLMPPRCVLCNDTGQHDELLDLCTGCESDFPRLHESCDSCAVALPPTSLEQGGLRCNACLSTPPAFDHVVAPFHYRWPVDEMLLGLKFGGQLAFGRVLGTLLARRLRAQQLFGGKTFAIVPVPLHWWRQVRRGFNQAGELARALDKLPGASLQSNLCRRAIATPAQSGLRARQRRQNVRGAFKVLRSPPASILLVDDVMTTGSTCNELARILKKAGAKRVRVACVARA